MCDRRGLIEALRVPIVWRADGTPLEWVVDLHDADLQADALIAEGWRKKPSEADLFSRDPDSALAAFVDSFNGDEAGDIDWVSALDGNTGYAMRGGNDVEAVFRKAAAAILALMDRGQ